MPDTPPISLWFVLARALHFMACVLAFGVVAFEWWVLPAAIRNTPHIQHQWRSIARVLLAVALPLAMVSGAAWFAYVTIEMSGLPAGRALRPRMLAIVWNQTHFGNLCKLRSICWVCTVFAVALMRAPGRHTLMRRIGSCGVFLGSAALCGSLAWAGHGQMGPRVGLHLMADVLHLLICGLWPMGLLPLGLLLVKIQRVPTSSRWVSVAAIVGRFSATSLLSVALLAATGIASSLFLVGAFSQFWTTAYGRALGVKIILFGIMVGVGAVNLLYWSPRLRSFSTDQNALIQERAGRGLRLNVMIEVALGTIVLLIVGLLGALPPAIECACP